MHRIGLVGAANIAARSLLQPVRRRDDVTVAAVAARRPGAAAEYARSHGIPKAYEGYEALFADDTIPLVYVALSPALHHEWTLRALEAGKHVLCEKPLAMNAAEAREMVAVAEDRGLVLMEAFHDRYHPAFGRVLEIRQSGALGRIRSVSAEFHVDIPFDPKNIRHDPAQGGGAMMDLGCYPVHWLRSLFGGEPEIVSATAAALTPLGVDSRMEAELHFGDVPARMVADIASPPFRGLLRVEGEGGTVELDNPCLPHRGHSLREWIGDSYLEHTLAGGTTYDYQLDAFLTAVRGERAPLTGGADAVGNMEALDRIYALAGIARPR
jgi:predicted dehydrogenase